MARSYRRTLATGLGGLALLASAFFGTACGTPRTTPKNAAENTPVAAAHYAGAPPTAKTPAPPTVTPTLESILTSTPTPAASATPTAAPPTPQATPSATPTSDPARTPYAPQQPTPQPTPTQNPTQEPTQPTHQATASPTATPHIQKMNISQTLWDYFSIVALGREGVQGGGSYTVTKWDPSDPPRVYAHNATSANMTALTDLYSELSSVTGLDIKIVNNEADANVNIYFGLTEQQLADLFGYKIGSDVGGSTHPNAVSRVFSNTSTDIIHGATIGILGINSNGSPVTQIAQNVSLYQDGSQILGALGEPGCTEFPNRVFSSCGGPVTSITGLDAQLLKLLYSPLVVAGADKTYLLTYVFNVVPN